MPVPKPKPDPAVQMVDALREASKAITRAQNAQREARRLQPDREMTRELRELQEAVTRLTVRVLVNS